MNLVIEKPFKLMIPQDRILHIYLVGVGGNGGHLAPHIGRLAWMQRQFGRKIQITFIDPDVVEEKNVARQNFCPAEIGNNKAESLAFRLNAAYGLNIKAIPAHFEAPMVQTTDGSRWQQNQVMNLIIDCVDGPAGRQEMHKVPLGKYSFLISTGNAKTNGHVMIGNTKGVSEEPNKDTFGHCQYVPSPYLLEPALLKTGNVSQAEEKAKIEQERALSCAELIAAGEQSPMVNVRTADIAGVMLEEFLKGHLTYFDVRFNISPPAMQTKMITEENLGAWL